MKKTLLTLALISFCCIPKLFAEESYRIELEQQLEKLALRCTESIQYLDGVTRRKPLADIATSLEILIAELKVTKDDDH